MEQFLTDIPSTPMGWIAVIALIISAGLYIRRTDIKSIKERLGESEKANDELRKRLDDKDEENRGMRIELETVKTKMDVLDKQHRTIQDLVVTALKQYFFENPTVANNMHDVTK